MSASLLSPSLFEDSDSDVFISTQSTTSTALEINQILYNLPSVSDRFINESIHKSYILYQRQRSASETSVYQDCTNTYESSDVDSCEDNEENTSSLCSTPFTERNQTGIETDGTQVSVSSRDAVIAYEVQEHLILPEYPDTDKNGILHIIHASKNPLENVEDTVTAVNQATSQLMSSVCSI
jgi:hypothetical protein